MKKEIIVKNKSFLFQYIDENLMWYLNDNPVDLFDDGRALDISIEAKEVDWDIVASFLNYLINNQDRIKKNISKANNVLKLFFKEKNQDLVPTINYNDIYFSLNNISFIPTKNVLSNAPFEYRFSFLLESKSDPDLFSYDSWNAHFSNLDFKSVSIS